jgi:hypothetical protein
MDIRFIAGKILVIRTDRVGEIKEFFEELGLVFKCERHALSNGKGYGPTHWSAQKQSSSVVLEIYPEMDDGNIDNRSYVRENIIPQFIEATPRELPPRPVEEVMAELGLVINGQPKDR